MTSALDYQMPSVLSEVMVGLEDEANTIVENLIYGSLSLEIVAIVGMAGIGKTTLANKVYNFPAIKSYFHELAYCIVSQVYSTRGILIDLLGYIRGKDDKMYEMTEEDLAHMLYKSLSRRRYLIIMDDIWDVELWGGINRSFPDHQNRSRVIFTTRNRNVALKANVHCIFHDLRFMSDEESWDLLQNKVFQAEDCPPEFLEVGKMIAKNCKGLPLTIVVIAGLLCRTERSLGWWNKISEEVNSYVMTENNMSSVLELSYHNLPEYLKPFFLSFGAFAEDKLICVKKLTLLWISKGLLQNSNMANLENVAREYLRDLVDRNFVIAEERSFYRINNCRIHDLVRHFCQRKAREENFLPLMDRDKASNSSISIIRNPYCNTPNFLPLMDRDYKDRKMADTCVDTVLAELSTLEQRRPSISEDSEWPAMMLEKIQSCEFGVRSLKLFLLSLLTLEHTNDADIRHILMLVNSTGEDMWGISTYKPLLFSYTKVIENWILDLQDRTWTCKQNFEEPCELLLRYSSRCESFKSRMTPEFSAAILQNLKDLYKFKTCDEIHLLNNQIVQLLHNLFILTSSNLWGDFNDMRAFKDVAHVFAQYSAIILFLYWVKAVNEEMATKLNVLLFDVLQKYRPCVPDFKAVYIRFLEELKSRQLDSLLSGQIVHVFLDLLLENLTVHISTEDFQIIQESFFFVISFLVDPPAQHVEDEELMMLTEELDLLVKEDLYRVLSVDDMNADISEENVCLDDFTRKAELLKGKIQQVYKRTCDSFSYDSPKIDGLGFFDFLLQNLSFLKKKLKRETDFIPFAKHLIIKIKEELKSLRPYLDDLFERQKEHKELKDTWLNAINLAYKTEYAINSCSVDGDPLWYNMARLMEVLDEIKEVYRKLTKAEDRNTHGCSAAAPNRVPEGPSASGLNEVMVGLEEEADKIVENLINGSKSLEIVAIVGMAGIGKTTMANKVYNATAVRNHFHTFAYCVVSQVYSTRRILLDILGDICDKDEMKGDLAHVLLKRLSGRRYLIIMDDIWDVESWHEIQRSLPNHQNGSRVIFTTRNGDVALKAKECLELLQKKTFCAEDSRPDYLEDIAMKCKGLPLTIVLIAGLLRTERSLRWRYEISEALSSHVLTKEIMSVIEFSYQHLPEHLKPCFLYFGAFVEDKLIRVNKLTLLWITEGFVLNSKGENLEKVARKYLKDLVDRSLVIANERSSYGGIKSCRIHDVVHEFCQRKAQEEHFFQLKVNNACNPYRLCILDSWKKVDARNICRSIRSLLLRCRWGFNGHSHDDHSQYDLSNLRLVQVMDLEELDDEEYFLREMHSVVHLRFMSISHCRRKFSIITLDNFISNHSNLEILILIGVEFGNLTEAFWNMTRLRHVDVEQCSLSNPGVKKHESPQMVNLESFSTLWFSSTEELKDLLQRSPSLRKLCFYCTNESIQFPKVDSLSTLESLNVTNAGEACLRSFHLLSSLKKLSLTDCYSGWSYLSVISEMPCLEVLKLLDDSFVGPKWDMEDTEFSKLKYLKLVGLGLSEWIAYRESFPRLEELNVGRCYSLKAIPPCFGDMPTLKRIEVYGSLKSVGASVVEIQEAQKDFGNEELQVLIH